MRLFCSSNPRACFFTMTTTTTTATSTSTTLNFFLLIFLPLFLRPASGLYAADVEKLHVRSWIRCRYAFTTVESRVYNADDAAR